MSKISYRSWLKPGYPAEMRYQLRSVALRPSVGEVLADGGVVRAPRVVLVDEVAEVLPLAFDTFRPKLEFFIYLCFGAFHTSR